jgi:hypothetical protein
VRRDGMMSAFSGIIHGFAAGATLFGAFLIGLGGDIVSHPAYYIKEYWLPLAFAIAALLSFLKERRSAQH